jgi:hypothetical protein
VGLQRLQFRNLNARSAHDGARLRSSYAQRSPQSADIGHFHVVHNDVVVKGRQDLLNLNAIGLHLESFTHVEHSHIRENAALRVEHKSVNPAAYSQIPDVIRNHPVQPTHPVATLERDSGTETQVVNCTAV